ncbi:hypothetical protein NDU88_008364 [Pleurodeles waltl]|uniref:Ig-like domain-containing protein n=1 Tax=Pleurodeles waltl TaxID=8319 RepID=A0AAV7SVG8_PLEWA|nr:hypothetical protein NDU88_008364 [Pleurodeles waltl]
MSSPRLCLALLLLVTGKSGAQSVSQSPEKLSVLEGSPLFINCTYKALGTAYLFWYFQLPGEAPRMLLDEYGQGEQRGFSAPHNNEETSFHLRKKSSEVGDSGLYLCAVRDTVCDQALGAAQKPGNTQSFTVHCQLHHPFLCAAQKPAGDTVLLSAIHRNQQMTLSSSLRCTETSR